MSERMRVLLVDDEAPARALLREYLATHPAVEVVGECTNGFEAVKAIAESVPDLVFLDIQMPKLDGFEVLELLEPRPAVIFCTAYDEYALKAFEVHAVDYLLKPVDPARLRDALDRAAEQAAQRDVLHLSLKTNIAVIQCEIGERRSFTKQKQRRRHPS